MASVPADHPYVAHLQPLYAEAAAFRTLPEIYREPDRWWPPVRLDAAWLTTHRSGSDVLHTHFGYESLSLAEIEAAVAALGSSGTPLVVTVHDLQNPHLADDDLHLAQMGALVSAAAQVITLTPGAADETERRWGRRPTVIAHPHVVELDDIPADRPHSDRIGVHLGDLRPRVDLTPIAGDLRRLAARHPVTIEVQRDAWLDAPSATRDLVESIGADLAVRPRPDDAALHAAVRQTSVQVLPYGRGTHSGWLEMCLDLGVAVAAPSVGYFAEQHPGHPLVGSYDAASPGSLHDAVGRLLEVEYEHAGWAAFRRRQRNRISQAHTEIYRQAVTA